jgi:hypothetical protein
MRLNIFHFKILIVSLSNARDVGPGLIIGVKRCRSRAVPVYWLVVCSPEDVKGVK